MKHRKIKKSYRIVSAVIALLFSAFGVASFAGYKSEDEDEDKNGDEANGEDNTVLEDVQNPD
ncbi:MAG: hypothetical protein IKB34_02530 [Clostridia bacterium]|nr:hypothetical protein [Clostridia bacterium]